MFMFNNTLTIHTENIMTWMISLLANHFKHSVNELNEMEFFSHNNNNTLCVHKYLSIYLS